MLNVNVSIEIKCSISYLLTKTMLALSVTVCEIIRDLNFPVFDSKVKVVDDLAELCHVMAQHGRIHVRTSVRMSQDIHGKNDRTQKRKFSEKYEC